MIPRLNVFFSILTANTLIFHLLTKVKIVTLCRSLMKVLTQSDTGSPTNLYRKKSFTWPYTNFDSLSPIQYKVNLVSVLVYRAYHICSSYLSFHEKVCSIKPFFQLNQFPIYPIDRIIRNFLDRQYSTVSKLQDVPKLPSLFSIFA